MAARKTTTAEAGETEEAKMMIASPVLLVSAPAGPRRRAGISFGKEPVELRYEDLGEDPDTVLAALRADPMLKIDSRYEERPADPE